MDRTDSTPSPGAARRAFVFGVTLGIVLLALDRLAKWFSVERWSQHQVTLFPGAHLTYLLNNGIAFSIPLPMWAFVIFSIFILAILGWFGARAVHRKEWLVLLALGWIVLGAASNIADRIFYGGVVDYLQIVFPSVINVADGMIVAGVAGVLWYSRTPPRRTRFLRRRTCRTER